MFKKFLVAFTFAGSKSIVLLSGHGGDFGGDCKHIKEKKKQNC